MSAVGPDKQHSRILSGSTALRRMGCAASARLEARHPNTTSEAAYRGTRLHMLMEGLLREHKEPARGVHVESAEGPIVIETEDVEPLDTAMWALDGLAESDQYTLMVELHGEVGEWAPGQGGTLDALMREGDTLTFIDFKFGFKPVYAYDNKQLGFYALCARNTKAAHLFEGIKKLQFAIIQPMQFGESADLWEVPDGWLEALEDSLKTAYHANLDPNAEPTPGQWCDFCKARGSCPAVLERVAPMAGVDAKAITTTELAHLWKQWQLFESGAKAVYAELMARMKDNEPAPGFKLVERTTRRIWTDTEAATRALVTILGDEAFKVDVLTPPAAEKKLGRRVFAASPELTKLVTKKTSLALVPASDKRPAARLDNDSEESLQGLQGLGE